MFFLRRGRPALAIAALLACASAHQAHSQTTYNGGGSISTELPANTSTGTTSGHSTLTVSGASGTVKTISVTLNGVDSNGSGFNDGMGCIAFVLSGPGGQNFELLGNTGGGETLSGATITVEDSASSTAPLGNFASWPADGGTVQPSSYWANANGWCPTTSVPTEFDSDSLPQTDGSATLDGVFGSTGPNGTWTLYIDTYAPDQIGNPSASDPISISSWSLTMTFNAGESYSTSTSVSSNVSNPGSTSDSYTLTATVTDTGGGPTVDNGTVAFTANGTTISGCGAAAVSGGIATCTTAFSTQGLYAINASYTAGTGFESSSTTGPFEQLVESPTSEPTTNTWCNTGSLAVPGTVTPTAYPSVIKVSGYAAGTTVANVEVELESVTGTVDAQHLLVAPDGTHNLDFFDQGFDSSFSTGSPIDLNFLDSAGQYTDANGDTGPTAGSYEATDESSVTDTFGPSSASTYDSSIPQVPASPNYAYDPFSAGAHGPITATFENEFNGAPANGTWALYTYQPLAYNETIGGGWCIALTLNSGVATTTALSSNANPQVAQTPVTLTAAVTAGGSPVTNGGTVTFEENGGLPAGVSSPNNIVDLSTSTGQASLTTGTVSSSIDIGNSQTETIYEGDYEFSADYSGVTNEDAASDASLWQRFDNTTTFSAGSGSSINACNTGAVLLNQGNTGPFAPNPSNIFVANLPGTISSVTLTLNGFYTDGSDDIYRTAALIKGPTGAALDFFSNTGDASTVLGGTTSPWGNLTFSDSASTTVPDSGNYSATTYKPTAYEGSSPTDTFTSSSSGFYNVPGSFTYAQPQGSGTFASTFGSTNPNGTWSLFFNNSTSGGSGEGAQSGWCLNFTETPVAVSADLTHSGTGTSGDFIQGETGAEITTVVTNNGTGPTGDPLGTNPLTMVDTLNAALTYEGFSGTGWSCSASGQTVTCTNDSAIAQGSAYPTLTLNVNVSSSAPTSISNSVTVSGAGITATTSNTDTIDVQGSATLAISKSHTGSFTQGSTGIWTLVVSNTAATGSTSGTVTVSDTLPAGYTLNSYTSTGSLWTCSGTSTVTCTGTPGIAAGSNSTITLTVNIPANSPTFVSNTASTWGGGDPVHNSSGTAAVSNTDTVSVIATTTTAAANETASFSESNQSLTLSATVTSTAGTVNSGTVTFTVMNGATQIGVATSPANVSNGSASATYTLPGGTNAGTYIIVASYTGAGGFTSSSDSTHTLTVSAASTSTAASGQTTGFNPSSQSVTLSATVTSTAGTVNAGTVTFTVLNGGMPIGTATTSATVSNGSAAVNYTLPGGTTAGAYTIQAVYNGSTNFNGSSDNTHTLTVQPAPPAQVIVTGYPSPDYVGVAHTGTVTVEDIFGDPVTTYSGSATITTSDDAATVTTPVTITSGSGTFTLTFASTGMQSITAAITGLNSVSETGIQVNPIPGYVVTTANDDPAGVASNCPVGGPSGSTGTDCSLRDALAAAASTGTGNITFSSTVFATPQTITLGSMLPDIEENVAITGPGVNLVTVSGNNLYRVMEMGLTSSPTMSISGLTIANGGGSANGDGIDENQGTLTISNCAFTGNSGAGQGGAINSNSGTLTIANSTFSGNSATTAGGAINAGNTTLNITDSTFYNNSSGNSGGAIADGITTTITNSTFAMNSASRLGGAIINDGTLTANNNIFTGNSSGIHGAGMENSGTANASFNVYYNNLANGSEDDCNSCTSNGNSVSATANPVAALGNYGGPTETMIPLPPSAAICAGSASLASSAGITTDQRGDPNTNTTYSGYSATSPCVDAGAVQTDYAMSFTTEPSPILPATQIAPDTNFQAAVTLDESGAPFTGAAVTIPLSLASSPSGATLSGGSATTSAGVATYSSLSVNQPGNGDQLTATLTLNSSPAVSISALSGTFNVSQITPTLSFAPSPASQTYGTAIISTSLDATASYNSANVAGTFAYTTTVNGNPVTLVAGTTVLPAGNYTITATFTPSDTTVYEGTSATAGYTVNPAPLTITASSGSMIYGSTAPTITASYSGFVNGDSAASLTTQPTCSTTANNQSSVGSYTSSCTGAVDANYAISYTAGSVSVTQAASTTTVSLSSASITPGQSETITVTVASSTTGTPTGTVNLYDGTTLLATIPLVGGVADYTTATLAPGVTHSISAVYSGDNNFTGSISTTTASVTVAPLDFTMTISGPPSATVIPGQSISYEVTVTPMYGSYAGTVNFAVTGLPPGASATFSPSSIAANGGPQTITVTITAAPATAASHVPPLPSPTRRAAPLALAFLLIFGVGAARRRGRALRRLFCILLLLAGGAAATLASGCGGGFFAQAPENYTVTITATAGTIQHTTIVTLNVQ